MITGCCFFYRMQTSNNKPYLFHHDSLSHIYKEADIEVPHYILGAVAQSSFVRGIYM